MTISEPIQLQEDGRCSHCCQTTRVVRLVHIGPTVPIVCCLKCADRFDHSTAGELADGLFTHPAPPVVIDALRRACDAFGDDVEDEPCGK